MSSLYAVVLGGEPNRFASWARITKWFSWLPMTRRRARAKAKTKWSGKTTAGLHIDSLAKIDTIDGFRLQPHSPKVKAIASPSIRIHRCRLLAPQFNQVFNRLFSEPLKEFGVQSWHRVVACDFIYLVKAPFGHLAYHLVDESLRRIRLGDRASGSGLLRGLTQQ